MYWNLPSAVSRALSLLCDAGYEAYIVGGCVRDTLMGVTPNDWDITTSALPEQTLAVFEDYRTNETGIRHGTVTVMMEDMPLEITTYRVDGTYSDKRRPDSVSFTPSLIEDLRRRDFTVNAMAYHPDAGLVDPFGGENAIIRRCITCVGDPEQRFAEDALRIIRGLRFAATLGFAVEDATASAIRRLFPTLSKVAAERITVELMKLLCGKDAPRVLNEFGDMLENWLPGVNASAGAPLVATAESIPYARLTALLFPVADLSAAAILDYLKLPNRVKEDVTNMLSCRDRDISAEDPSLLRLLYTLGVERALCLLSLRSVWDGCDYSLHSKRICRLEQANACYSLQRLAVTGEDLIKFGITPGPEIGKTLEWLLFAVMDGLCENDTHMLLDYIKTKKPVL